MEKKSRMGVDPLSWIQDSRDEHLNKQSKSSKHEKNKTHSVQSLQELQNKHKNTEIADRSEAENTSQIGLRAGWIRATFIMREDLLEKLKDISYWDRKSIKDLVTEIFESYLKDKKQKSRPKKKEHGEIQ